MVAFRLPVHRLSPARVSSRIHSRASRIKRDDSSGYDIALPEAIDVIVGENLPEEILNHECIYDMILVERFSSPLKTNSGILLPAVDGKDQRHMVKVLSMPQSYGLESENGRVAPIEDLAPYKVGDIVYVKV